MVEVSSSILTRGNILLLELFTSRSIASDAKFRLVCEKFDFIAQSPCEVKVFHTTVTSTFCILRVLP